MAADTVESGEPIVAEARHGHALLGLRQAFIESQIPFGYRRPSVPLQHHVAETTARLIGSSYHRLLVTERSGGDNDVIGYALGLRKVVPGLESGRIGLIEELYVAPGRRGTGVGARLHTALLQRLTALGVDRLEVQVLAQNEASVLFWQRQGYRVHLYVLENDGPL